MHTTRRAALAAITAAGVMAGALPHAWAHDVAKGPNGGQVVEVKGHHVELTTKGGEIRLYLTDAAHAPLSSKGASGRVVILEGSKQSTVPLASADPNLLTASAAAPLASGARLVVSAKLADGHDLLARFVVK